MPARPARSLAAIIKLSFPVPGARLRAFLCRGSARNCRAEGKNRSLQLRVWGLLFADVYAIRLSLSDFTYGTKQGFGYVQASDFYFVSGDFWIGCVCFGVEWPG